MTGRECYHCKQWIEEGDAHDCWTTTEEALTADLSDELREAWERLRETAAEFGEQRIYASGSCVMFSRTACYFFVRPRRSFLELSIFLGRAIKASQIKRAVRSSNTKVAHIIQIRHRDEVEPPITDWLREAYEVSDTLTARGRAGDKRATRKPASRHTAKRAKPARTRRATRSTKSRRRA